MTLSAMFAYASPLAVGFGSAAALALTRGAPAARRLRAVSLVWSAILVALVFTGSLGDLLGMAVLVTAFGLFVAGLFLLCEALRMRAEVCQLVAGLAVVGLMSTVFLFAPVIEQAAQAGMSGDEINRRISLTLDLNPWMVMGYSIFDTDLLVSEALYPLGLADYQHQTPDWSATSLGYSVAGLLLGGAALGVNALLRRRAP